MQVPNMIVMAPSDEVELIHMVATAAAMDRHPICFRFPRGNALGLDLAENGIVGYKGQPIEVLGAAVNWINAGFDPRICRGCNVGNDESWLAGPFVPRIRVRMDVRRLRWSILP